MVLASPGPLLTTPLSPSLTKTPIRSYSAHAASGWRIQCGVEVTELSTNKQLSLSLS